MSLNQSMNISLGSMKNNQYALTVVSQNIANLHVEGYHRQRVNFATNEYTTNCENVLSTIRGMNGASITSLSDYIDNGAFKNMLNSNSDANYYNTLADALGELEGIADDLGDNGLNALLNDFYAAAANLEQFPTDMSIRQQYVLAAQNVCEKFNQISSKCDSIQEDKFHSVGTNVELMNNILSNIADANVAFAKNGGSTQSDINNLLQELSQYTDVTTTTNENGTVNVFLGGVAVVQGGEQKYTIEVDFDSTNTDSAVKFSLRSTENPDYVITDGVNEAFSTGSMKAYVDFLNGSGGSKYTNVNDMKLALNQAASAFATELNKIQTHDDGNTFAASLITGDDGNLLLEKATVPMFTSKDGGAINASNIQVNTEIADDPFKIAAARIDLSKYEAGEDWTKSVGNSDNATLITASQNSKILSYNGGKNNCTLSQFLTNNAAKAGMDIANIQGKADTAQDIADADATNYINLIGVNLDEELSDMIKYQRAYEASAKLFSTINDLMGTIIGMV